MKITDLSEEQRAKALYYYFGWQGGTVHQLAQETGLSASDILYRQDGAERLCDGFCAIRTCDRDWRVNRLAPKEQGNWPYWRDTIIGYWITGELK